MRFLIADDHSLLRDGLAVLLQRLGPDVEVFPVGDGPAALAFADSDQDLDAAIIDLSMPGMDGASLIEALSARRPDLPVIVLSASESAADVRRVMALGALGYVPKSANPETLLSAIRLVLSGELYVPPLMLSSETPTNAPGAASKLTPRQADVLACMERGLANKAIASELSMSEKTVKAHVTAILRVLGVSNRTQAVTLSRHQP